MNLLAIETTGAKASVALINTEGILTVCRSDQTLNHLQHLIPMTDELLVSCGSHIGDVSVLAVSEGPGSFTGIRIGMATAKALAQALDVPVVGVPTLESFVYHMPEYRGLICPIFDARRSQVYAGIYRWEREGMYRRFIEDGAYEIPEYLELLGKSLDECRGQQPDSEAIPDIMLFGDGIAPYGEQIRKAFQPAKVNFAAESDRYQHAASVAKLGYRLLKEGKQKTLYELHPVYLRKAEAERKLEEAGKR